MPKQKAHIDRKQVFGQNNTETEAQQGGIGFPAKIKYPVPQQDPSVPLQSKNSVLPGELQSKIANTMGEKPNVKINLNSSKATKLDAIAVAQGKEIDFAPGQFKPHTKEGQQVIGHEFEHIRQQQKKLVKADTHIAGFPVNTNKGLEDSADKIGRDIANAKTD